MQARYDYIVIGAGHNGLTAATMLALNGASVLVVEARPTPGGEASGASFRGAWYPRVAYALGLMPAELAALLGVDLGEAAHWTDPSWVSVVDDEVWLAWWRDPERLDVEFARHGVASGWRELRSMIESFRRCSASEGVLYTVDPPGLGEAAERLERCRRGLGEAVSEPWIRWAGGLIGRELAEALTYPVFLWEPGFVSLYFNMNLGVWGIARRGFTRLAHRLEEAARRAGADILYGVKALVTVRDGRVSGVRLGRRFIEARRGVVLAASILCLPRILDADAYESYIEKSARRRISELASTDMSIDRVNIVFEKEPRPPVRFKPPPILSMDSPGISGEAVYPTLLEGGREGYHVVSFSGATSLGPEELAYRLAGEEPLEVDVVDRNVLDKEYCNPTGAPNHVPMTREHLLDRRPLPGWGSYTTPIEGLYHASASSHPGGQVTGIPGHNAAVKALLDSGVEPSRHLIPKRWLGKKR
jgi:phytoene dehydrogenase-like protein